MQTVELVAYLSASEHTGGASAEELARAFDASERTVRSHIHRANDMLSGIAHIDYERRANGYVLTAADPAKLAAWVRRTEAMAGSARTAAEGRVSYLLDDLLHRTDWVTIADLAAVLFVSPQSISGDLKAVEEALAPYGLTLAKRPRYGVRVEGPEIARRLCLATLVSKRLMGAEAGVAAAATDGAQAAPLEETVAVISDAIERELAAAAIAMSSIAFHNLVVHVVVALARIRQGCFMPLDAESLAAVTATAEYAVARRIAAAVDAAFGVTMPASEVAYIAIHLAGKKSVPASAVAMAPDAAPAPASTVIPDDIWQLAGDMLERVWDLFRFDFRDDLELRMNLARHLVPLATRLKYHLRSDNPLLSDIKARFPLAYAMAFDLGDLIAARLGARPSDEETGYIALSFALALERQRDEAPRKNVLVVCASGAGTTRLLASSIRRQFGNRVGTITTIDALHVAEADFSAIDYVFTTVPLAVSLPVPVQEIHQFLDEGDVREIDELFRAPRAPDCALAARLFDERLFVPRLAAHDRAAAIDELAARLVAFGDAPRDLASLVHQREQTAPTAFGGGIALPHPIHALPGPTRVAVGLFDAPVPWGDQEVSLVMLVAIGREDPAALDYFFTRTAALLSRERGIASVLAMRTYAAFLEEFTADEERS